MGILQFRVTSEGIVRWVYLNPTEEEMKACADNPTKWYNENVAGKDPYGKCRAMRDDFVTRNTTRDGDIEFVIGGECGTNSIYINGQLTKSMKEALFRFRLGKLLASKGSRNSFGTTINVEDEEAFRATFAEGIQKTDPREFFDNLDEMLLNQAGGTHDGIEFEVFSGANGATFLEVHVDIGEAGIILQGFVEGIQVYKELYRDWLVNPTNKLLDRKISFFGNAPVDLNPNSKLSVVGAQHFVAGDLFVPCPSHCQFSACNADNGDVTFTDEANGTFEGVLERIEIKRYCLEPGTDNPCE